MFRKETRKYIFIAPAKRKGKKYSVFKKFDHKYITSFGSVLHEHYKDKIGYYSHLDHLDPNRRKLYYKRHNKAYPKESADWFSKKYLW
jgi:hypothetical protein